MKILNFLLPVAAVFFFTACQTKNVESRSPEAVSPQAQIPQAKVPEPASIPKPVSQAPVLPKAGEVSLFDGKTLTGWAITDFGGHGEVIVDNGQIDIHMGADLSGITWTNGELPKINYEVELDAMKRDGNDFFCGLTFPVKNSFCSLICGGWGGSIVGLSSIDGLDASENETSKNLYFERNRWFHIRLRVLEEKIEVWIDEKQIIDVGIKDRKISMRFGDIERSIPLGIATWQTSSSVKNIKLKRFGN